MRAAGNLGVVQQATGQGRSDHPFPEPGSDRSPSRAALSIRLSLAAGRAALERGISWSLAPSSATPRRPRLRVPEPPRATHLAAALGHERQGAKCQPCPDPGLGGPVP